MIETIGISAPKERALFLGDQAVSALYEIKDKFFHNSHFIKHTVSRGSDQSPEIFHGKIYRKESVAIKRFGFFGKLVPHISHIDLIEIKFTGSISKKKLEITFGEDVDEKVRSDILVELALHGFETLLKR